MSERTGAAPSQQQWLSVSQVLALAEQHRQAGRLAVAEDLCRQVLRAQPRNAEVLHLLGIVLHQGGNASAGIESIKQAIAVNGNVPLFHCPHCKYTYDQRLILSPNQPPAKAP